jgi:hypothetical protein
MRHIDKVRYIKEIADKILKQGLRVFIAENGTYGFYTDETGTRIVTFGIDLTIYFSGSYRSENNGNGWRITDTIPHNFKYTLYTSSPFHFTRYTTLNEYLAVYQKSSKFEELT